ncbi:Smr/MutS family protein [bacterium]|nr:Smr/MutS family protein [bacterium]
MEARFLRIRGRERIYPVSRINADINEVVVETELGDLPLPMTSVDFIALDELRTPMFQPDESAASPQVDLHGLNVEDALSELERAIENALAAGRNKLLVIHGKGSGVLRQAVWEWLRHDPRVSRFALDYATLDGTGATRVQLV